MNSFADLFAAQPTITAEAPGRVNLIGEHTDYNGGFVLPTVIPQKTRVELSARTDDLVRVWSDAPGCPPHWLEYQLGAEHPGHGWLDFIQGATKMVREAGHKLKGFHARITSTVPLGSGLSSSASLTVALMRGLRQLYSLKLDDRIIAVLGQRIENRFVGARVGIMDPMAASLADERTALFLDCRSLQFDRVPLPKSVELIVINSGVAHNHSAGDYNTRRAECEEASAALGVRQLRDIPLKELFRVEGLPEPLNRRARHVVTENQRVLDCVTAFRAGDLDKVGQLFFASHASMRDDYQVSVKEIDLLVDLARNEGDVIGARLTGGGFGGSVVMLSRATTAQEVAQRIAAEYGSRSGRPANILVPAKEKVSGTF
jgi:galactokinase